MLTAPDKITDPRQLAVIMFADMQGYTAMMEYDETMAMINMNRFREQIDLSVDQCKGNLIQFFGDGSLIIFHNATDAVTCAMQLQQHFREPPVVPVRIGIHLGDIVFKEGNIFGGCVNIASRIESMGTPGSVLISDTVYDQVKNKKEFNFSSLGIFELKNVLEPMEIFALANDHFPVPAIDEMKGKGKEIRDAKSIAVLPFVNMSNDPEQEYFSDGITEEIINSLSHLSDLSVAGRSSAFKFKGENIDLREVGKMLNVNAVLEGSVRKQGNKLRITAQLINVSNGFHVWSERYDKQIQDVFQIQEDIATAITEKMKVTFLKNGRDQVSKKTTQNTEAYELYLKGRFYQARRGSSLLTSLDCFKKAIAIDPDFAQAYASIADTNLLFSTYGIMHPKKVMTNAKIAADKAIALNPALCEPYCILGYYYSGYQWNWAQSKKHFLKSLEINPKYAEGHFRYAWNYLSCIEGKFDEAEKHAKLAIKLEPLSSICYATYSLILHTAERYEEALVAGKTGIEMDANSFVCHLNVGRTYIALKKYDEAISAYLMAMKLSNRHHFTVIALIWTYCLTGQKDKAEELMVELNQRKATEYVARSVSAISEAYMGNMDAAFENFEMAYNDHDPLLILLKYDRLVPDSLGKDLRFQRLLKKIGFPN